VGFIGAQRTLEPGKKGDPDVIGKLLSQLFRTADTLAAAPQDRLIVSQMKDSVARVESAIQDGFDTQLRGLLPALSLSGFPGLNDTELRPHTTIDIESVLTDNTRILYSGMDGVHLPEGYNGLGTRNLIYILFQLEIIHKSYRNLPSRPAVHLVFIEEPEAHQGDRGAPYGCSTGPLPRRAWGICHSDREATGGWTLGRGGATGRRAEG
jgi:putative ATP-dependent endonuclease of OLD family